MSKPKLLADENIPRTVVTQLRKKGYYIFPFGSSKPGMSDEEVIELAIRESRIIITFDKDFWKNNAYKVKYYRDNPTTNTATKNT